MILAPDYTALFAASPYPYLLIAPDFTIIGANPAYLRATGKMQEEVVGKHIFEAFPANPEDTDATNLDEVRTSIELAISTRKPHTSALLRYAVPRDTPDGVVFDERYWSAVHTPVFTENGDVAFVSQNAVDVTDLYRFDKPSNRYFFRQRSNAVPDVREMNRPEMHEAMARILNAERSQLQTLFNQAPGFISVLRGKDHVFELVNEAYYQLVGHRDIIGRPLREALPDVMGQGFEQLIDRVFETGQPVVVRGRKLSVQRQPNGPVAERYIDSVYQPILADDGRVTGIFSQGNDVTPAYEATNELGEKVQELEAARGRQAFQLQVADTLRTLSDPSDIFTRASGIIGRYLGVSRVLFGDYDSNAKLVTFYSNYTDGSVSEMSGPFPSDAFGAANFASIEDGSLWVSDDLSTDPRTCAPDMWPTFEGLAIHAAVAIPLKRHGETTACLFITEKTPRHWAPDDLSLLQDVAERIWNAVVRVRADAALLLADRRKDQFLAMLAHELRNPLAPISSAAELLKLGGLPPVNIQRAGEIITRQVAHMTGLIDDLLDVSRVSTGLVSLERKEVDINRVVSDAVEQIRPLVEKRKHSFNLQLAPDPSMVIGDHKRLVQVFANLMNNAAKYTPEGGSISVKLENGAERVGVCVIDNGIGISPDLLPHVFDLFAQGERTPDRSQGGLGLGLALVKSLVELHSGSVVALSNGANAGSEFTVRLPRLKTDKLAASSSHGPFRSADNPSALRLMVVDDNIDAANMLAMFLQAKGHEVLVEHDPLLALQRARNEKFDGYLLDIGLPKMDGNELARQLRQVPGAEHATMVAITGYGNQYDRQSAMDAGFDEYLVKPAEPKAILSILKNVIASTQTGMACGIKSRDTKPA